ncbi:STAS/SEC14 domain-containing protein [Caulobacter sp. LARHSG274]
MMEVLASPDHVVAMKLSGTINGEDYDRVVAEVDSKLDAHDKIGVLVDLTAFKDLTVEAGAKDVRYSLRHLWQLKRFPRDALITDKEWVRVLARIASPIVPHVEIRTFCPGEQALALSWVSDIHH